MQTAEIFLSSLNKGLGEGSPKLSFVQKVDYVYTGMCSHGRGRGHSSQDIREDGSPNEEKYRRHLQGKTSGAILVISECCGQYPESFQKKLGEIFPDFTWIFPQHKDFCEDIYPQSLARDLVRLGVLG